jgi:molybdopterin/thiamine biosynthesis adenylyltransferase/rhodanese-related sulfurtransferase
MARTFNDLMREARAQVRELWPDEAQQLASEGAILVDIREQHEWEEGHIPGAIHVPRSYLEMEIESAAPQRGRPVVLYCAAGVRSLLAGAQLRAMGYDDPVSMAGGFELWKTEGLPWTAPVVLTPEQKRRYSRHLLIPEVGSEGQARLLGSRVLFIGAGGLGSPAMLYLAAAGVGTIGIVDFDVVDASNLQRQVIHTTDRVGVKKTESAGQTIRALNPDITLELHEEMLTEDNVDRLIAGHDIVFDAVDTFETRYILNDAAVRAGINVVHASVFRFEGQMTVFKPYHGPCYRCLYPTPPPPELAPGCSVAGVLGVVPGVIGLLQATEALKVLLGIGDPLIGRLLLWDALDGTFQELKLRRDPNCPVCGEHAGEREVNAKGRATDAGAGTATIAMPLGQVGPGA